MLLDVNNVFADCVEKWAVKEFDVRINEAIDKFDDWIKDLEEDEQDILAELLEKFSYYPKGSVIDIIKNLNNEAIKRFGISNRDSIVCVVRKADGKLNSSYEYWMLHRNVSGLSKKIYYDTIDYIDDDDWKNIKNVVFVDDCSGTGQQFGKFLKRQKKSFLEKQVILIAIEIMEEAIDYIKNYSDQSGINIEIIYNTKKEKAFKHTKASVKKIFFDMSKKREIDANMTLGFQNAEALMAFYNNSPNDTLGLFWFPFGKNIPIFPREKEEEPGWKQSYKKKQERRRQQYESKCNR